MYSLDRLQRVYPSHWTGVSGRCPVLKAEAEAEDDCSYKLT